MNDHIYQSGAETKSLLDHILGEFCEVGYFDARGLVHGECSMCAVVE